MTEEFDSRLAQGRPSAGTSRRFVVGVDGSLSGRCALAAAAQSAARAGAELVAVHVRARHVMAESLMRTSSYLAAALATGEDWRNELERDARADCGALLGPTPVRWRFVVLDGDIVTELHRLAAGANAARIYVGARTRGTWRTSLHRCPALTLAHSGGPPVTVVEHR